MAAIIDYRGKSPDKTTQGVPLVTAKIVKGGRIETPNEFIAEEDYDDWMRRGMPEAGDVVMTTEAPLGEIAQLDGQQVALAQRLITSRQAASLGQYLFEIPDAVGICFSEPTQSSLHWNDSAWYSPKRASQSFACPFPPYDEQRDIGAVLGALDDKIELNRRMNETLEALAQTIFKNWFVDAAATKLPKGWRAGTLGEVAENPRRSIQPDEIKSSMSYIGLEHMPRRSIALSEWESDTKLGSNKLEFKRGEILFGKLRPYFHKVGVAPLDGVCSTDILVVRPKTPEWFGFVLGHVSSVELVNHTDAASTGTKMPRTNWNDLARFEVALPPESLAAEFTATIRPMIDRIIANIHESRTLAELRDALLPKLLSGELRVPGVHTKEATK